MPSENSWASRVVKNVDKPLPARLIILGGSGIGKTTLAASMPNPLLIDYDHGGADNNRVDRIKGPESWPELLHLLREISKNTSGYKTVAIDTLDGAEIACVKHVIESGGKASLAAFQFGSGYEEVASQWRLMLSELDAIRAKGLYICLIAHSTVKQVQDPRVGAYDQITSGMNKKPWQQSVRWSDGLFFCEFVTARVKDERRAILTGERVLHTTSMSGAEGKNRWGLPSTLPMSWPAIHAAIEAHNQSPATVIERIEKLAVGTDFAEKAKGFIVEAAGDVRQLLQIEDALKTKIAEAGAA